MLKKLILSTLFAISSIAFSQIKLDLDLTLSVEDQQIHREMSVMTEENEITSVSFDDLSGLVVNIVTHVVDEKIIIETQFAQRTDDTLVPVTEWLSIQVPVGEVGNVVVQGEDQTEILLLLITPSFVKSAVTEESVTE